MYFSLDPKAGTPLYLQLKEQMRLSIAAGVLQPGEQLPTVRDLAAQLRINPNTVARVYRELQAEGFLASRQGSGTFVADGALALADAQAGDLVRQRMRGAIALGLSTGMTLPQLRALFGEMVDEAGAAGVVGRNEWMDHGRDEDE